MSPKQLTEHDKDKALIVAARIAVAFEKVFDKISSGSLAIAEKAQNRAIYFRKLYVAILSQKRPSLEQWVNRLIEHVDSRFLLFAYQQFLVMLESGMDPEQAFNEVIGNVS